MSSYPTVKDLSKIGEYEALAKAGGGYVWDHVLEYRVWCSPCKGAHDFENGNDYYYVFETGEDAIKFANTTKGAESPLALIIQEEYIDEPEQGNYVHVKSPRIAEWPIEFLSRPKRRANTIPDFLSPNAPENRLDIIRGLA